MKKEDFFLKILRRVYIRITSLQHRNTNSYGKEILSAQVGNDLIYKKILEGRPFLVSRLGNSELDALMNHLQIEYLLKHNSLTGFIKQVQGYDSYWRDSVLKNIHFNAGFFPLQAEMLKQFSNDFLGYLKDVDLLGVWNIFNEDYIVKNHCIDAQLTTLRGLEPYFHGSPWSKALKGKKVLVIHPFEKSIINQYNKRHLLFHNPETLPDFDLQIVKAIQSHANEHSSFSTWFDALAYMMEEVKKKDFHIAIIGAGAYGLPLGALIKRMGKQAIHMGGASQILFGIKGKRWDDHPIISSLYNENWVRPTDDETPKFAKKIEDGCYW